MLHPTTRWSVVLLFPIVAFLPGTGHAVGIVSDHNDTDITTLSQSAMQYAKDNLHIAYGHTSHGSQLTTGMTGLVGFANGGGLGLSLPADFFAWNNGGTGGALDLHDYAMSGDVGYYPQWVNETTSYLGNPANADVNVIIWSWCGQVDDKYAAGTLHSEYITPMTTLEATYPDVTFVYMTGHVDHWDDANNKAANQVIRDHCATNGKVLYDFADIESYDPDGTYYEFPNDNCDYYASVGGALLGNWATAWQGSHVENTDWYNCSSAHSEPLNANRKAYAAWALWTEVAAYVPTGGDFSNHNIPNSDAGGGTTASLPDGQAGEGRLIEQSWRAPGGGESQLVSDVLALDGLSPNPGDELYVLEMSYNPASGDDVYLAWYDTTGGQWVNAVLGNSDGGAGATYVAGAYDSNLTLSRWGVDSAAHVVWGVFDHNSDFAVSLVPEPSTFALAAVGLLGMLASGRRRKR